MPLYALLQAATEREHRARAIAANNVINAAAMVVSSAATMALIAVGLGIPGIFLLTGSATLAVAIICRRLFAVTSTRPKLRGRAASSWIATRASRLIEGGGTPAQTCYPQSG